MDDLEGAAARLRAFRQSWNAGDVVDENSGLTSDDLDAVLVALARQEGAPEMTGEMLDAIRHPSMRVWR